MADVTLDLGYGRKIVSKSYVGPASYVTGGFVRRISGVNNILDILKISNDGGFKVEPADCTIGAAGGSGGALRNEITIFVRCYEYSYAGACGPAVQIGAGADLSGVTFEVTVLGI